MTGVRCHELRFTHVDGFTLPIREWSCAATGLHVLTGPSGSGKTTLLDLLAGLRLAESGILDVAGTDPGKLSDHARRMWRRDTIGLLGSSFELVPHLSVHDNIRLPWLIAGQDASAAVDRELVDALGIAHLLERPVSHCSRGEQQRTALARVLSHPRPVLILDEPSSHLDRETAERVLNALRVRAEQACIVVASHDDALIAMGTSCTDISTLLTGAPA